MRETKTYCDNCGEQMDNNGPAALLRVQVDFTIPKEWDKAYKYFCSRDCLHNYFYGGPSCKCNPCPDKVKLTDHPRFLRTHPENKV